MQINIIENILIAIENIEFNDKAHIEFQNSFKEKLEKANCMKNGFEVIQSDLDIFFHENEFIAIEFINILKGYYLRKLVIEKTGNEKDFRVFKNLEAFENRFLNKYRSS